MAAMSSTGRTPGEHPRWRGSPHDSRDQTPDKQPCRRGAPLGRGSVYAGKSSIYRDDSLSDVDYRNKIAESTKLQCQEPSPGRVMGRSNVRSPENDLNLQPVDIVKTERGGSVKLNKSFLELNREKRKEIEQSKHAPEIKDLRSVMVLLKNYISHQDQREKAIGELAAATRRITELEGELDNTQATAQTVAENADRDGGCLQEALTKIEEMESTAQQAQDQGPIASQEVDYYVDTPPTNADMNFVIEMRDTTSSAARWVLAKNDALEAERRLRVEAERRVAEHEAIPRLMHEALNKLREKELAVTQRLCADFDRDHAKMERMLASERERRCQAKVERESFASSMVSASNSSSYCDGNSSKFSNADQRNKIPQHRQISPVMDIGSTNMKGSHSDMKVYAGKSSIHRDDNLSHVDYRNKTAESIKLQRQELSPGRVMGRSNVRNPESDLNLKPFDILKTECGGSVKLNKSLLELNREKKKEIKQSKCDPEIEYLRSGMVLLKNCISHQDQVQIIKRCQQLGLGCGGFYRPGYRDGAKLHLHMMCLGKNWDPQTREYEDIRSFDGAAPPKIPEEFTKLVHKAIQKSHEYLQQNIRGINVEDELPMMAPDICIMNFYSNSGKLGLHQDRDESKKSIDKGLPVVSFSLGDSAEFLYGEGRDVDKAEKVELESGDVLIFGGKSRLLFHGVPSILQGTAPKRLIDDTKLKPGRLNLTFRQYLA